jgi:heptose I phosphotransferase
MKNLAAPIACIRQDHLRINRNCEDFLKDANLYSFDAIWNYAGGRCIKDIRPRSVHRMELASSAGRKTLYLKRHRREFLGFWRLFPRFFWFLRDKGRSQGMLEFENILEFRRKGLQTVVPIAAGERFIGLFRAESFLLTEDFHPYVSLESLLATHSEFFEGDAGAGRKKILIREIAALARKMHEAGFNHQDFNATHILLHYEDGKETPELALFDMQRVEKSGIFRLRWKIKSLARLNYTLPDPLFTSADRKNLLLFYKGKARFTLLEHLEWFWILQKTDRIRRHTEKKQRQKALTQAV